MFWRISNFSQSDAGESVVDRSECKLELVLPKLQLIQELKAQNVRAVEFMSEPDNVQGVVRYLVAPPAPDTDQEQARRLQLAACEVLCCEVDAIVNELLQSEATLDLLFSLLQQSPPLDCSSAGYFARVVGMLLFRRTDEVMAFLRERRHLLKRLVVHLDTASICEVLIHLTGAEEHTGMYLPPTKVKWLLDTSLMADLLAVLDPGQSSDAARYAAEVLAAVARSSLSPLQAAMAEPQFLSTILVRAFDTDSTTSVQALDVCIALLERGRAALSPALSSSSVFCGSPPGTQIPAGTQPPVGTQVPTALSPTSTVSGSDDVRQGSSAAAPQLNGLQAKAVAGMVQYVDRLGAMLVASAAPAKLQTSYGVLDPPLGAGRLKAVELVAALSNVGVAAAEEAVAASGLLLLCMRLFLQFPYNNMLHHQVAIMVVGILDHGGPNLLEYLFGDANLLTWLTEVPAEVVPQLREGDSSDAKPTPQPLRAGYMGHVTVMANKLVEAAPRSPFITQQLAGHDSWQAFCNGPLKERNALESLEAWQCGRPVQQPSPAAAPGTANEAGFMALDLSAGSLNISPAPSANAVEGLWSDEVQEASRAFSSLHVQRGPSLLDDDGPSLLGNDDAVSANANHHRDPAELFPDTRDLKPLPDFTRSWIPGLHDDSPTEATPGEVLPSQLPPTEPAVIPHLDHETADGLDAHKAPSAAVPPPLAPPSAHPTEDGVAASPSAAGPDRSSAADGVPGGSSSPGRARSSVFSAAAWLRSASSKVVSSPTAKSLQSKSEAAQQEQSGTVRHPPRSAFASWKPAWQAVEDSAADAAARAAEHFVAHSGSAIASSSEQTPSDSQAVSSDSGTEAVEKPPSQQAAREQPLDAAEVAAKARRFGMSWGSAIHTEHSLSPDNTDTDDSPDDKSSRDGMVKPESAATQVKTSNLSSGPSRQPAGTQKLPQTRERAPDGRPKFNFGGLKSAIVEDEKADMDDRD